MPSRGGSARRYAQAVFEIAREAGGFDAWQRDLDLMGQVFTDRAVGRFFRDPKRTSHEKEETARRIFDGRVGPQSLNLVRLLARNSRTELLPRIGERFGELVREARGIVVADVTTAVEVNEEDGQGIAQQLAQMTGKSVQMRLHVDPSIIGGVVVRIGDKLIDGSVTAQLQRLRQRMDVPGVR